MDMTPEAIDRFVKITPVHKSTSFELQSVIDPTTGKPAVLQIRPIMITELITLYQRFQQIKLLFFPTPGISRADAFVMAGIPAIAGLIAQNQDRFRNTEFEAWVGQWPDEDRFEYFAVLCDMSMPEGIQAFLEKSIRYLVRAKMCPAVVADLAISQLDRVEAMMSGMLTKMAALPPSTLSMKSLIKMLTEDEEETEESPEISPKTPSSSSPNPASNSNSEDAEPTLGL